MENIENSSQPTADPVSDSTASKELGQTVEDTDVPGAATEGINQQDEGAASDLEPKMEEDEQTASSSQSQENVGDDDEEDDEENVEANNQEANNRDPAERLALAVSCKEEGNFYFQSGKLDQALRLYRRGTVALKGLNEHNTGDEQVKSLLVLLQTNLSMVCWKQQKYELCKNVATQALNVDANNVKALYRRGMAFSKLGELDNAKEDLKRALEVSCVMQCT